MPDGLVYYLANATDAEWHHRLRVEAVAIEHRWTLWNGCVWAQAKRCERALQRV
jgi:hypothetical protein